MKYIIHSCNDRLWYVNAYLIPSLINQGISRKNIILFNDDDSVGNQQAWYQSCLYIKQHEPPDTRAMAPDRRYRHNT